ncbi:MAG TPA: MBL fold metallo-hydrolase, partial [Candidatus Limnocylindrales bacterium]|nr:MBL fold metallo-hydrolase [Candidatus Limnocylindrales bacterium]
MEIATGIRRLGPGIVNSYLLEDRGGVTIFDAGAPAYYGALTSELAAMGRTFDDIRAVVLTHAHTDHIGFAERLRKRGVRIHVHTDDVALTRKPQYPKFNGTIRPGATFRFIAFALRHGMTRIPPILEVSTFTDG